MASDPLKRRVVDPGYELFWKEVAQAVNMATANNEREIDISVGDRNAKVFIGKKTGKAIIQITDYDPPQPVLIVPPGGMDDDQNNDEEGVTTGA